MDIGPYRLDRPLGRGAMGEVWSALHRRRGVRAAVKRLRPQAVCVDARAVEALQREVRAIALIDHPNVVALYDQGTLDGAPWLAMELGTRTLGAASAWGSLRRSLLDVLAGLGAAHARGLLHLDIKPSNVLVHADGRAMLADFGISHSLSRRDDRGIWGSPAYMAPEAFDGLPSRLGRAADLYSVGCLAWALITGAPPFAGSAAALADAHRAAALPPFAPRVAVPVGLEEWLRTLLRKVPGERYQSASDAALALAALPEPLVGAAGGPSTPLAPTLTTLNARPAQPRAPLTPALEAPPRPTSVPEAWPAAAPIDGWARGCGLVGVLAVPWLDRADAQETLWRALRGFIDGDGVGHLRIGGLPGSGRSRLLRRFLLEAHQAAGCETVWIDQPGEDGLRDALVARFGADPEAAAVRLGRAPDDLARWHRLVGQDPGTAAAALPELLRAPLVVGVDGGDRPHIDGALIVEVVDGDGDVDLVPFDEKTTRRLLAAWAGLDPQTVADVCEATGGDLASSVELVTDAIRSGRFTQSERGWRHAADAPLVAPPSGMERWRDRVSRLLAGADTDALRQVAVLRRPASEAWTEAQRRVVQILRASRWIDDDGWVSTTGQRALQRRLGDLGREHLAAASHHERWQAGEHLLAAGRTDAAAELLLEDAWRITAMGQMSRVQRVLGELQRALRLPDSDPRLGKLYVSLAKLGPTHQGYERSQRHAERAVELARAAGFTGEWRRVARMALGHLLFHADVRLHPAGADDIIAAYLQIAPEDVHLDEKRAWIHLRAGDGWSAMRCAARAATHAPSQDDHNQLLASLTYWIAAHTVGHVDARERYAHASQVFLDAGFLSAEMDVAFCRADMARRDGDLDAAERLYDRALRIAAEGEARADAGPFLGAALCAIERGRCGRAIELLDAARAQLGDAGPSWEALVDLYTQWAFHRARQPIDAEVLERVCERLRRTGYLDRDVLDAYRALVDAPGAPPAIGEALTAAEGRVEAFRAAERARPPMPEPGPV